MSVKEGEVLHLLADGGEEALGRQREGDRV